MSKMRPFRIEAVNETDRFRTTRVVMQSAFQVVAIRNFGILPLFDHSILCVHLLEAIPFSMRELQFTVDSALLSELGEKLVETPHIALVELVKNSYDADATEVIVTIEPNSVGGTDVTVTDNGSGMTFDDVQNYWMRIATTHKENTVSARYGRPRTGKKGIGRFACRRLGNHLELRTIGKVAGGFQETVVSFPWSEFTAGKEITTIPVNGSVKKTRNTGTKTELLISGNSNDEWSKRGFDYLKRQLAVLAANRGVRRKGFEEDPGFNISLIAPDFTEEISNLRDDLLEAGWGDLTIEVKGNGEVRYELNAMKIGKRTISHPKKFPRLAGIRGKIGIMSTYTRDELRRKDVLSKTNLKEIVDEWGGVFVRLNGFRVYPYGEKFNDWLRIERDRGLRATSLRPLLHPFAAGLKGVNPSRTLLSLLSSRSYIGDIEIDQKASKAFEPKTSREGFLENEAFQELREVVRFGIDWTTIYREYFRSLAAQGEAEQAREDLEIQLRQKVEPKEIISSAIRVVQSEVKNLATKLPTEERQQILRSIKTATDAIEKREAANAEERRHLQLVASTSSLLLIFSHEVKSLLSWLEEVRISLDSVRKKVPDSESEKLRCIQDEFGDTKDRLLELLSMTSLISVARKVEPTKITLLPRLKKAVGAFDLIVRKYAIEIDLSEVSRTLQVGPMLESELYAIILNVVSNSIKSVIASGGERKIQITANRTGKYGKLNIRDNGVGIDESQFENVFAPFISDPGDRLYKGLELNLNPEDEHFLGTGSGLGLSIAREILEHRGGKIRFVDPPSTWRADIEIVIP